MMNDPIIKKVIIGSILVSVILAILCYLIWNDMNIAIGFILGTLLRLMGLNSIKKMVSNIELVKDPNKKGYKSYLYRMILYSVVIWVVIDKGINLITFGIGIYIMNLIIIVVSVKGEKDIGY